MDINQKRMKKESLKMMMLLRCEDVGYLALESDPPTQTISSKLCDKFDASVAGQ